METKELICELTFSAPDTDREAAQFALRAGDFLEIVQRDGLVYVGASGLSEQLTESKWLLEIRKITQDQISFRINTVIYDAPADKIAHSGDRVVLHSRSPGPAHEIRVNRIVPLHYRQAPPQAA